MRQQRQKQATLPPPPKQCHFCVLGNTSLDYKDPRGYQKFISSYSKILPRRRTGLCMRHQRMTAEAIKRARFMALVPYTPR
ncbi:MAG: 30S ribosomal protein S18 [Patescibacteria group bacterium]|jgi:small subunit ribosomal protein S18